MHFVYWGRHFPGVSKEIAKRVLELAPMYEVKLHDLHGYHFQHFHFGHRSWKVVPRVGTRNRVL